MSDLTPYDVYSISTICPVCGQNGTFYGHNSSKDIQVIRVGGKKIVTKSGLRFCPNRSCNATIFYSEIHNNEENTKSFDVYPKILMDFDSTDIPDQIVKTFKEAIICHGNSCFKAAGTMIRRTLEELCENQKCEGKNLHERLESLKTKIVIPNELLEAAFELKLLGNDATHIEAKTYNEIGQNEIEIGVELTKELLKATYQYKTLLKKLEQYKKT